MIYTEVWPVVWSGLCRRGGGKDQHKITRKTRASTLLFFSLLRPRDRKRLEKREGERRREERERDRKREKEGEWERGRLGGGARERERCQHMHIGVHTIEIFFKQLSA